MGERQDEDTNLRRELVRERLIDKAADLFATRGFSRTTMNDIAEGLGLSRSSLYHYFHNKEEILEELIEEQTIPHAKMLRSLLADDSLGSRERLVRAFSSSLLHKLTGNARFRVLDQIEFEMPERLALRHRRRKREILDLWCRLISDGASRAELRRVDPRMAAFALLGISNWTAWWFSPSGKLSAEAVATAMIDIALNGLASRSEGAEPAASLDDAIERLKADVLRLEELAR